MNGLLLKTYVSPMENDLISLFDNHKGPSSSISSGIGAAEYFDPNASWEYLHRLLPLETYPGETLPHALEKLINRTCLTRKCLVVDELMSSMAPLYEWGDSPFVTISKKNNAEIEIMPKDGRDSLMVELYPTYNIEKFGKKKHLYWSDVISISHTIDRMFFKGLDMMADNNNLTILFKQDESMINNLHSAFSSVECQDILVSKIVCNPCHSNRFALGETVGEDLNTTSLQREWYDAGSLSYPHIWTSDILVSSLCPEDKIYLLPDATLLGATPLRDNCHGIAIVNKSFSVLKLG
jgi:hypothetical protein